MTSSTSHDAAVGASAYDALIRHARETDVLAAVSRLLGWDQEVMMPAGAAADRAQQRALLARLVHERVTDPRVGDWLAACEQDASPHGDPLSPQAVNLRELRWQYDRATKLPASLVEETARHASAARHAWIAAKKNNDFAAFAPALRRHVELARQRAECWGWDERGEPWDALAEDYEPDCPARAIEAVFTPLRDRLVALVARFLELPNRPTRSPVAGMPIDPAKQDGLLREVVATIGFDFNCGRLDTSAHPFSSSTHPTDVRLTTRYDEDNVLEPLSAAMHEAGHGLYSQGQPLEHVHTPMGEHVSLAIHESQSRTWENFVGRCPQFWRWCLPILKRHLGAAVAGLSRRDVLWAMNFVQPTLIRVEADEVTYNLHIMIRFELERALIGGDLDVSDLPAAWNAKYREYLGAEVPDDRRGCLQDVHWAGGAFGYFPTYALGNLYAAQFFEAVLEAIPELHDQFAVGRFADLLAWQRQHIHSQGKRHRSPALCEAITGKPLSPEPLLRHLEGRLEMLASL